MSYNTISNAEQYRNVYVYVIGAQCTGKTTLVNALEAEYGRKCLETGEPVPQPSVIREVARTVLKEKSFSRDDITDSPARALQLQKHILDAQLEAEETASRETGAQWYICDRSGLDPIVYARVFVGEAAAQDMLAAEAWKQLKTRMKTGVVVLCEAGCSWLVDDGTRLMPKGTEDWMRIDRAFRDLLAGAGISYVVVPKALVSLAERVALVVEAVEESGRRQS